MSPTTTQGCRIPTSPRFSPLVTAGLIRLTVPPPSLPSQEKAHPADEYILAIPPWPSTCGDVLRPPVKARRPANQFGTRLEGDAALGLGLLKLVDAGEMAVDRRRVGQRTADARRAAARQLRPSGTQCVTSVPQAVRTVGVGAVGDLANPVRRVARHDGHGSRRHAASQQCPHCGHTAKAKRPEMGLLFVCGECHHTLHADLVGARNIALRTLLIWQDWVRMGLLSVGPDVSDREAKAARLQRYAEVRWSLDTSSPPSGASNALG
jgi:hypothetical protein